MVGSAPPPESADCALARRLFAETLRALDARTLMRAGWQSEYVTADWKRWRHVAVLALGKAAGPMLAGWLEAAAPPPGTSLAIRLALPAGAPALPEALHARYRSALQVFAAGHPEPDGVSLRAGAAMLATACACAADPEHSLLVALISGGGSALAEVPLDGDLERLRALNRALLASGAPIGDINCIRKHRSALKGGRLAGAAAGAQQITWVLSDMPPGEWRAAASGPTCPDESTHADFAAAWRRWLPGEPEQHPETPKPGDAAFADASWHCLADNHAACEALAAAARAAGRDPVVVDHAADEWEEPRAAEYLLARWRALVAGQPRAALIAGGEVRVRLPRAHGRGGRNQQLALGLALSLAGSAGCLLSAGTDGVDGASDAAGACVDGATAARIRAAGLDAAEHLRRHDAHPALAAAGALIHTSPTGNNLRDLRLFLSCPVPRRAKQSC